MTNTEKIVIVSTGVVAASAITMMMLSKKYDAATSEVLNELKDIEYNLSRSREDIIIGNKEIVEGNRILRTLIKQSVDEMLEET